MANAGSAPKSHDLVGEHPRLLAHQRPHARSSIAPTAKPAFGPFRSAMTPLKPWPGNVREVIGVLSQAAVTRQTDAIDAAVLRLPSNAGAEPQAMLAAARVNAGRERMEGVASRQFPNGG